MYTQFALVYVLKIHETNAFFRTYDTRANFTYILKCIYQIGIANIGKIHMSLSFKMITFKLKFIQLKSLLLTTIHVCNVNILF